MFNFAKRDKLISIPEIRDFIDTFARLGDRGKGTEGNWHEIDKKTGNLGYGWVHYCLIRNLRPRRVLVIGSRYGFVPAICALACCHNRKGVVDFVDAGYDYKNPQHAKHHWGGIGFWTKDGSKVFAKFGLVNHINLHVMTSRDFAVKHKRGSWGYINIDGDHSYDGVKFDFETFWPCLQKKGFISLHDIFTKDSGDLKYGVPKYWGKIKLKYRNTFEFKGEFGLGVVQKL